MTKIKLSEVRQIIREELMQRLNEFVSNEMANGTAWHAGKKGWGAKNLNGVTDYFYGEDEINNKERASKFSKDSSRRPPTSSEKK